MKVTNSQHEFKTNSQVIITNQELEDIVCVLENFGLISPTEESYSKCSSLLASLTPILDKNLELEDV